MRRQGSSRSEGGSVGLVWIVLLAVVAGVLVVAGLRSFNSRVDSATANHEAEASAFEQRVQQEEAARAAAEKAEITLTVDRPEGRPMRVLFVGDSLTAGYYATTKRQAFVSRVARTIGNVTPLGGQQVADGHGKTGDIERVDAGADLAVVELGTDDVEDDNLRSFKRDYRALLDMVDESSPGVPVLCLGVWHPFPGGYDRVIEGVCRDRGGKFVSLTALEADANNHGPEGRTTFRGTSDMFHPNDRGHRQIAKAIMYHLDVR